MAKLLLGNPFGFPEAWHSIAYFSSFFVLVPSILVIMLVTNEYTFKTHRQNIIDGLSRYEFVTAKLLGVLIVSMVATLSYFIVALIFGISYSDAVHLNRWTEQLKFVPLFLLQTFAQLSIAFLLGFLLRKAFIALGLFLFYYLIIENIIRGYMSIKHVGIREFLPFEISNRLIPLFNIFGRINPDADAAYQKSLTEINAHIIYTIIFTAAIWWLCYWMNKKRDL
jgi:ABC-type transport system involved in multi-copper enzyme maturation permease subunit